MSKFLGVAYVRGLPTNPTVTGYGYFNLDAGVLTCNNLMLAFESTGMIPIDEALFNGQIVGKFSATVSAGNTQMVIPTSGYVVQSFGYKVYKHPRLNVYIKIEFFCATHGSTSNNRLMVTYTVGTSINSSGFVGQTQIVENISKFSNASYGPPGSALLKAGELPLRACCGDDFFWLATSGNFYTGEIAGTHPIANSAHYPSPLCMLGIAFFAQAGEDKFCIVSPASIIQDYAQGSAVSEVFINSAANAPRVAATKMRVFDGEFYTDKRGYYPSYPEPWNPTGQQGLRIYQGNALIGGKRHWFDYGTAPSASLNNFDVYELDILGHGVKPYMAVTGFGSYGDCGTRAQMTTTNAISLLLPWE